MSQKIQELLRKTAAHCVLAQAVAAKQAEEIALHSLTQKAAMDEISPTLDALVKIGAVRADQKKEASAALANHAGALVHMRKLAEMVLKAKNDSSVGGPGVPMVNKTAGDSVRSVRDAANDEFTQSQL